MAAEQQRLMDAPEEELHQFALHAHFATQTQAALHHHQQQQQQQLQFQFEQQLQQQQQQLQQQQFQQQLHAGGGVRGYPAMDAIPPAATTLMEVHTSSDMAAYSIPTSNQQHLQMQQTQQHIQQQQVQQQQVQQQQVQQQQVQQTAPIATTGAVATTTTITTPVISNSTTIETVPNESSSFIQAHMSQQQQIMPSTTQAAGQVDVATPTSTSSDVVHVGTESSEQVTTKSSPPTQLQLYKTSKMRRPELWQFIRLVVPDPPTVAAGKKYTNQDAKEAYCLKCKRMMHYNTGSSNNVSRHMAKFHPADLASYEMKMSEKKRQKALQQANNTHQQHSANANGDGSSNTGGRKRKLQRTDHHGSTAQSAPFQLIRHGDDGFSNAADVDASGHGVVADADTWSADSDDDTGGSKPMIEPATSTVVQAHGDASLLSKLHDPGPSSADAVVSSVVETEKLNTLIAKWVCKHYHPFGITEDPEFQAIINFAINMKKSVSLPLPPQSEVRASVESLSARTRLDILHQLTSEVLYFSIATEFWTTTERDVFISFSIHYLTEQFDWRHFTLDVREYNGHLSPEERKEQVDMLLTRWNLDPRCMNTILWDSYNPPPTENEFIPHHTQQTESVAHVIQCIISPIFHAQKELTMDDVPLFFVDEQINTLVSRIPAEFQHGVHFLREYVGVFRDLAWFLTNHPRAVVWMSKFMAGSAQIRLIVDSKSNWLTTVDMLRRLMRKKEVIRDFFAYIETSEGRLEFQHSGIFSRTLPGNEQWCAIECLLLLLQPFESVAVAINKEKYASSCLALALLRFLKRDLEKANDFARIFAIYAAENSDDDIQFKQKIAASIDVTRKFLHGRFLEHFDKISNEYMWISQLDPRFVRMKYLSDAERENCKTRLVERCLGLTNALQNQKCNTTTGGSTAMHESAASSSVFLDFQTNKDDNDTNIFLRELLFDDNNEEGTLPPQHHHHHHHHLHPNHHPPSQNDLQQQHNTNSAALATATSAEMTGMMHAGSDDINQPSFEEQQANLRQQIVAEVDLYYQSAAVARVPAVRDPLQWWRENAPRLPLLAPLARKWLAPVGSVRPTETLEIPSTGMATSLSLGGSGGAAPTHHHANGAAHHYVAVHCDPELVRDMVFVHDNC